MKLASCSVAMLTCSLAGLLFRYHQPAFRSGSISRADVKTHTITSLPGAEMQVAHDLRHCPCSSN